ncbi:iron transporter [Microaerobacter geothermalis]|uniref:iron transporter n=1 Tax=Microaerobacter geothermalis TaxID=674972 RepID=UPI001F23D155|nr:iron transporter [Microaerobacter geothermalis]MCF6094401.1 iron transporter [Microaerobacter geothermalis]
MKKPLFFILAIIVLLAGCSLSSDQSTSTEQSDGQTNQKGRSGFREFPIGDEIEKQGMKISAVYFQPVVMEPKDNAGLGPDTADVHLEADIHALKDNPNGFGFGEWVPYLTIDYRLENVDTKEVTEGSFMPMNAADGPHYGANVKMSGTGEYKLTFTISRPQEQGLVLHVDKETGVEGRFWDEPITVEWTFPYLGRQW